MYKVLSAYLCVLLGICTAIQIEHEEFLPSLEGTNPGQQQWNCTCGWANRQRIVGGRETLGNEYPSTAALQRKKSGFHFCGATILTQWHALSAAHCFGNVEASAIVLNVGGHDITRLSGANNDLIPIAKIINHEDFRRRPLTNDISLLVTERRIRFSRDVGPACLPKGKLDLVHQKVTALGWGRTDYYGSHSDVLMGVDLRVLSADECAKTWSNLSPVLHMCTFKLGKDSCNGDSGGPLLWFDSTSSRYNIVGLVSFGRKCAGGVPGVNTDVTAFIDWINNKVHATVPEAQTCSMTS